MACRGAFVKRTCHRNEAANEAEVGEVIWVDGRRRVDLQTVVALSCVLKQAVHGVQHLMGQEEEPLPERRGGGEKQMQNSE